MPSFYVFEVRLLDVKPRIWRKFALSTGATFKRLHSAIQDACGWENRQAFQFHATREGPVLVGVPSKESKNRDPDAARKKLSSYFRGERGKCFYQYDFGDDWWLEVRLVGVSRLTAGSKRVLLGGELAFPPENCGGPDGYRCCVAAVSGRGWSRFAEDWNRSELQEWLDGWKPDDFSLARAKVSFDE